MLDENKFELHKKEPHIFYAGTFPTHTAEDQRVFGVCYVSYWFVDTGGKADGPEIRYFQDWHTAAVFVSDKFINQSKVVRIKVRHNIEKKVE